MRKEKQLLLDEIKDKMHQSKALVVAKYQGINPNMASDLRIKLAKSGGAFSVVKKRILMKAAEKEGLNLKHEVLQGHIGVVFAFDDPVQTTKAIYQFSKDNAEALMVLGGKFEGKFFSAADVKAISELPSKEEMRAQFLGLLEAPMAQTLSTMDAILTSILHCIENKVKE